MATQSKKILIIEDEESIRNVVVQELEKAGYSIIQESNGQAGLATALEQHPDLVMLDIMMPKMHGIEVLDNLQNDEWGKTVPVLLLTNYADDPRVSRAVKDGRAELLEKGKVKLEDVVKRVKEVLGA